MRILFLDDEVYRHIAFYSHHKEHDLVQVTLPYRAIQELEDLSFDEVWLDHDLGETTYYYRDPEPLKATKLSIDSKQVVDWIVKNKKPEDIPKIVIHSWNFVAAEWMQQRLEDCGFNVVRRPFNLKIKEQ